MLAYEDSPFLIMSVAHDSVVLVYTKGVDRMKSITATDFSADVWTILKEVINSNEQMAVALPTPNDPHAGVVMISKGEWSALQEELYLHRTGTLEYVEACMETATEADFEEA